MVLFATGLFLLFTPETYMKIDAIFIWVLTCLVLLYFSTRKITRLTPGRKILVIGAGFLLCLLSILRIPLGVGHTLYSMGDFTVFLSGLGLILFGALGFGSFVMPLLLPLVAVEGFQVYDLFIRHIDWLTAPLVAVDIGIVSSLLHLTGIPVGIQGQVISFVSSTGLPVYLSIEGDCTGLWSLGTFTMAVIIVAVSFPRAFDLRGILYILLGFLGTYAANILRIYVIILTGYYYGLSNVMEHTHIHIGWLIFTAWMVFFWYLFFVRHVGISFTSKDGRRIAGTRDRKAG
ncbi:MAG TPA: exosortase/archaeosortase family protein [Methanomicrobiales archaeon]|nr:exosortase/archaeosortase family protein [Methanomicrobiales archaeon]